MPRLKQFVKRYADRIEAVATIGCAGAAAAALVIASLGAVIPAAVIGALAIVAGGVTVALRRLLTNRRLDRIARETETLRLATGHIARDQDAAAKALTRLNRTTDRAIAAAFGRAIGDGRTVAASPVDPAVLAAALTLATGRRLHYVGDPARWAAYVAAFEELSPDSVFGLIPSSDPGAYLDQHAARRRDGGSSVPVFVAEDRDSLADLVDGRLGELIVTVLGTPDYLVLAPTPLHAAVTRVARSDRRATTVGNVVLMVSRQA